MQLDPNRPDLCLGVIGAGAMGRGIAQVAAQAGIAVRLFDVRREATDEAVGFIEKLFERAVKKGRLKAAGATAAMGRITIAGDDAAFSSCHVVVEAIAENLEAKRALFARLDEVVEDDCILATNTSSLSVTAIASASHRPGRVAGFHFFNPVAMMKVVEIVRGALSDAWVIDALSAIATRMGHLPVVTVDMPGFLINHAGRGFGTEGLRIVQEGIAGFADVDCVLREAVGFRMGPFELMDLTGLDVSHAVMESIYEQFYQEPRFRPAPMTRQRVAAGLLGRKSGRGFYDYVDGKLKAPQAPEVPAAEFFPMWISPAHGVRSLQLLRLLERLGIEVEGGERPSDAAICLVAPLGVDATTSAVREGLDPSRTLAVDTLFGFERRRTLMTNPLTSPDVRRAAHAALARDGKPVTIINDSPGFVAQRVVATIANIGCDIAQQRIAPPDVIDRAVTIGLGYPKGPLEFGDAIGACQVIEILEAMQSFYGDSRYRPSPWLRRRAMLGVSLTTPE